MKTAAAAVALLASVSQASALELWLDGPCPVDYAAPQMLIESSRVFIRDNVTCAVFSWENDGRRQIAYLDECRIFRDDAWQPAYNGNMSLSERSDGSYEIVFDGFADQPDKAWPCQ